MSDDIHISHIGNKTVEKNELFIVKFYVAAVRDSDAFLIFGTF